MIKHAHSLQQGKVEEGDCEPGQVVQESKKQLRMLINVKKSQVSMSAELNLIGAFKLKPHKSMG